jgi:hypothetical protein
MDSPTKPVNAGTDTTDQIPAPPAYSGRLTRSQIKSGRGILVPGIDGITPNRPSLVGTSNASSTRTSSSATSSSTYSSTFDDDRSRVGTPPTPLSDDDEDAKRLGGLCATDLRKVSKLSLTSEGVDEERFGDSDRSREIQRPSTPQPEERDEELESTGSMSAVTRRLSRVEIHNESPIALTVKRRNLKKPAEAAEEAGSITGISEALGALGLESKSDDTDSRQEPEEIDEAVQEPEETDIAVVSGASHGPQPEQQQKTPLDVIDSCSSEKIGICTPPTSGTSLLSEAIDQQSAATAPTTRPLTPTSTPDKTAESSMKAGLDATASLDIGLQGHINVGLGSTSVGVIVTLSQNPPEEGPRRSPRLKEMKEIAVIANATTGTIAAVVGSASVNKISSLQSSRRGRRAKQTASRANKTTGASAGKSASSRRQRKGKGAKQKASTLSQPTFSNYNKKELTGKDIHDKIFKLMENNGKLKVTPQSSPKAETKSPGYGYLYIYTSPMCPNHVKIGMTSGTPLARITQWGECGLKITRVKDDKSIPFLHFQLAEKLIKAELHNVRRKYSCRKCQAAHIDPILVEEEERTAKMVNHGEWYGISEEKGLATVQKWRSWFVTYRPFNADGVLRPRWAAKLDPISARIAIMDREEWVAEWIRPLEAKEIIPYFWSHSIRKVKDTWSDIKTFLWLLLGLLSSLQRVGEKGVELLPFFGRVILVSILACIIKYWIDAICAIFFVILIIPAWMWMNF